MSTQRSPYHKLVPAGILILAVGLLAGLNVLVSAITSPGFIIGVVDDWTHHHVAFRNAGTAADALARGQFDDWYRTVNAPRYVMQQMRRNTMSRATMTESDFASRMGLLKEPSEPADEIYQSGGQFLCPRSKLTGMSMWVPLGWGPGNYPAKFSFNGGASSSDIAVFNTSVAGGSSAAAR